MSLRCQGRVRFMIIFLFLIVLSSLTVSRFFSGPVKLVSIQELHNLGGYCVLWNFVGAGRPYVLSPIARLTFSF